MMFSENNPDQCILNGAKVYPGQRYTVSCRRVIASGNCTGSDILIGNGVLRNFTCNEFPVCKVEQGGFLVLDFGIELSGGVRIVTDFMLSCSVRLRFGESVTEACSEPNGDHAIHDVILTLPQLASTDFGNTGFRFVRLDVLKGDLALVNVCAMAEMHNYPQPVALDTVNNIILYAQTYRMYRGIENLIQPVNIL